MRTQFSYVYNLGSYIYIRVIYTNGRRIYSRKTLRDTVPQSCLHNQYCARINIYKEVLLLVMTDSSRFCTLHLFFVFSLFTFRFFFSRLFSLYIINYMSIHSFPLRSNHVFVLLHNNHKRCALPHDSYAFNLHFAY